MGDTTEADRRDQIEQDKVNPHQDKGARKPNSKADRKKWILTREN
jgi:hypothetical protein